MMIRGNSHVHPSEGPPPPPPLFFAYPFDFEVYPCMGMKSNSGKVAFCDLDIVTGFAAVATFRGDIAAVKTLFLLWIFVRCSSRTASSLRVCRHPPWTPTPPTRHLSPLYNLTLTAANEPTAARERAQSSPVNIALQP